MEKIKYSCCDCSNDNPCVLEVEEGAGIKPTDCPFKEPSICGWKKITTATGKERG